MPRAFLVPLIVLVAALAIVIVVVLSSLPPRRVPYRLASVPTPGLAVPLSTPTPEADAFVEYFPQTATPPSEEIAVPQEEETPVQPESTPTPVKEALSEDTAMNTLLAVLADWIYTDYTQIASKKMGRLEHIRNKEKREISEGTQLERGVEVASLSPEKAVMQLADATFPLRIVRRPSFFDDPEKRWGPRTPEEQREGLEYYMRVYGDKMRAIAKNYKPLPGVEVPKSPPTKEEIQESKERYMQMYGDRFQQQQALQQGLQLSRPEIQRRNFERYWRTYHPDKPIPNMPVQPDGSLEQVPLMVPPEEPQASEGSQASANPARTAQ